MDQIEKKIGTSKGLLLINQFIYPLNSFFVDGKRVLFTKVDG